MLTSAWVNTIYDINLCTELIASQQEEESTGETVILKEVDLNASGNYTCAVIGETPRFSEDNATKYMTVVGKLRDVPPRMHGLVMFNLW